MQVTRKSLFPFLVIATVIVIKLFSGRVNTFLWNDKAAPHFYLSIAGQVAYYFIPVLLILGVYHGPQQVFNECGLNSSFIKAFVYAFLFTLPMLIGYQLMGSYQNEYSLFKNFAFAFKDGFREEIFYRAFLFGQLFRHARWGFLPAVGINGLIFGLAHHYQAHNLLDSLLVFGVTFAGAIWFAWMYIEWKESIWISVFLHTLMNFYWDLFSHDSTAVGNTLLNLPRFLTILIAVIVTIKINKRQSGQMRINHSNLLRQQDASAA